MASQAVVELRRKSDAAWANLTRQLDGLGPHADRSDAPGEWTTREVLCHLLGDPTWKMRSLLDSFSHTTLPLVVIEPGETYVTPEREAMSVAELTAALDEQRHHVIDYLEGLSDADLGRKARIPLFQTFMGTDEIPIPLFVDAMFDYHWNDHAGHLAKIRAAVGLPAAP